MLTVCVRHPDGTVVCGYAYTGQLSAFHHSTSFIDDDDAWLSNPPVDADCGVAPMAPSGYGLVVYDRVTHTIISLSSHATPGSKSSAFAHLLCSPGGYGDERPAWEALNTRGLLSVGPWFQPDAPRRMLDPDRTIDQQLGEIGDRDNLHVDMFPWSVVEISDDDAQANLEQALLTIGMAIPEEALADWEEHFDDR